MISERSTYLVAKGGTRSCRPSRSERDQHLAIAIRSRANADGRHFKCGGRAGREIGRNRFEHDGERSGILQRERVVEDDLRVAWIAAALPVAALLVHRLRRHAEVPHHRYAHVDEPADDIDHRTATLDLDGRRAGVLQQASGIAHGFGCRHLVGQKRHVGDDERALRSTHDRGRVMNHHVERDRQGRVVPENGGCD